MPLTAEQQTEIAAQRALQTATRLVVAERL